MPADTGTNSSSQIQSGGDGVGGVSLEAIVDEDVARAWGGRGGSALDQGFYCGARLGIFLLGLAVGLKAVDRLLIGAAGTKEKARGEEIGGEGAGHLHLLVDRRHFRPAVENMGDVVRVEHIEVFRSEQFRVAHFDAVLPVCRQLSEERVDEKLGIEEVFVVRARAITEALELGKLLHRDFVGDFVAKAESR